MKLRREKSGALAAEGGNGRALGKPPRRRIGARLGYRGRNLALAVALGIAAVVVVNAYVNRYQRDVELQAQGVEVLVAARDIPVGTPGTELAEEGYLVAEEVPRRSVVPGVIASERELATLVAAEPIYAGEQVTTRRFRPAVERGIRGELGGTLRAMAISGEANQVLAGRIEGGDHVDVVAGVKLGGGAGGERQATAIILRDVLVLDAPAEMQEQGGLGGGAQRPTVVLALTDAEVQKLFYALRYGDWALVLRTREGSVDSPGRVDDAESVIGAGVSGEEAP